MMNIKDKAGIAFHYIANLKFAEAESLYEQVAKKDYTCTDLEFSSMLSSSILFTGIWASEYWKNMALRMVAMSRYFAEKDAGNVIDSERAAAEHDAFERRALAIDAALEAVCQTYGLFPGDVRKMANNAIAYEPINKDAKADPEYLQELLQAFNQMIESWPGNALQKFSTPSAVH